MNDIDAMYAYLDKHPNDHTAQLVLADMLNEAGSPLGEGYRALGILERRPTSNRRLKDRRWFGVESWFGMFETVSEKSDDYVLPRDWLILLRNSNPIGAWRDYPDRRVACDEAAAAFVRLPDARKQELLAKLFVTTSPETDFEIPLDAAGGAG